MVPVETAADRLAFLDSDEFAVIAGYTPEGGGGAANIKGIFDSDANEVDFSGEVPVQTRRPRFVCRVDDLTDGGSPGDTIDLSSAALLAAGQDINAAGTYAVREVKPDGTGMVELMLEKQ